MRAARARGWRIQKFLLTNLLAISDELEEEEGSLIDWRRDNRISKLIRERGDYLESPVRKEDSE